MDVREPREKSKLEPSKKFTCMEVDIVRSRDFGLSDATIFTVLTHIGRHLKCGDSVLAYDIGSCVYNEANAKPMKGKPLPEVVIIRKTYPRYRKKNLARNWTLARLPVEEKENYHAKKGEKAKADEEEEQFLIDIEEDEEMRGMINIYKQPVSRKKRKIEAAVAAIAPVEGDSDVEEDYPQIELEEMIDSMDLRDKERKESIKERDAATVTMKEEGGYFICKFNIFNCYY